MKTLTALYQEHYTNEVQIFNELVKQFSTLAITNKKECRELLRAVYTLPSSNFVSEKLEEVILSVLSVTEAKTLLHLAIRHDSTHPCG